MNKKRISGSDNQGRRGKPSTGSGKKKVGPDRFRGKNSSENSTGGEKPRFNRDRPIRDRSNRSSGRSTDDKRQRRSRDDSFGDRKPGFRSDKPFSDRPRRPRDDSFGDRKPGFRSDKPFNDRPRRSRDDSFGDRKPGFRSDKPFSDRPRRSRDDSFGDRKPGFRSDKPFNDRPRRPRDDSFGDRKPGFRSDKPFSDRPRRPRDDSFGDRKPGFRSDREPRSSFQKENDSLPERKWSRTPKKVSINPKKITPILEELLEEETSEKKNLLNELSRNLPKKGTEKDSVPIRINRYLAKCSLGSRRDTEQLVIDGLVKINGMPVASLSSTVRPGFDIVTVNGKPIEFSQESIILALNKPAGFLSSHHDVYHDKTVFQLLPQEFRRLNIAGRLDLTSRGLMLLTSDGELIQDIAHPSGKIEKIYIVTLDQMPEERSTRELFIKGLEDSGEFLRAKDFEVLDREKNIVKITLKEGKKRQIHRMFSSLGIKVTDLQRIRIGKLDLNSLDIKEGEFKKIHKEDITDSDSPKEEDLEG